MTQTAACCRLLHVTVVAEMHVEVTSTASVACLNSNFNATSFTSTTFSPAGNRVAQSNVVWHLVLAIKSCFGCFCCSYYPQPFRLLLPLLIIVIRRCVVKLSLS
ncbi:unnamed protein product [Ceratitis capitata]|uniref:(Mediterranean fruit fly) hypothetical protein n=1 Tax=Ceratitis capitata TaxID=7213 RepID=A0A811V053_CERCA|nr:unnamed protein product [Ceratitis capitata]